MHVQVDDLGKAEIMLHDDAKQALQAESAIRGGYSPVIHPEVPISVFKKRTRIDGIYLWCLILNPASL